MKRILPAFVAAAVIHVLVLMVDMQGLIRNDPIAPRTQVTSLRLVDRVPVTPTAIHPLPAAPPPLPPMPKSPAVTPKPVKTQPKRSRKKPLAQKAPLPSPPVPSAITPAHAPEPEPSTPSEKVEPVPVSHPSTPVETPSPPAARVTEKAVGETGPVEAAIVVATPRYSDNPPPPYPSIARKRKYQGTVMLDVFVEKDGRVGDLRIIDSSSHASLDRSAVKAVRRWQFEPGRQGDRTIAMWVRVPVQFILK